MSIDPTAEISLKANLDRTYPAGVVVGAHSWVAFNVVILTHDRTRRLYRRTVVGRNCFIGAGSMLMPGVVVGDNSVVAAGAVVTKDVPPRSVVAGNPATVIRSGISVGEYGQFRDDDGVSPPG
jgi:acetyltransferase-like isoleucine patch superfamily enzyme